MRGSENDRNDPLNYFSEARPESDPEPFAEAIQSRSLSSGLLRDRGRIKFKSARRALKILNLVSQRGMLSAKHLAQELGVSLSTCYFLINVLLEEGYLEKAPRQQGYRLGPAIPLLYRRFSNTQIDSAVEPVISELAQRSKSRSYFAVLEDGATEVTQVKVPPKSPPIGVSRGFSGASHALALGKVLLANAQDEVVKEYVENQGLEAFTSRTIIYPDTLQTHLKRVRALGYATDIEEFAENLCCLAVPIVGADQSVIGALGVSTTPKCFYAEAKALLRLTQDAAKVASKIFGEGSTNILDEILPELNKKDRRDAP